MASPSDRYASAYGRRARVYHETLDPTLEPVARRLVELGCVAEGTDVLDLATGTGLVARMAQAAGARVHAIDVSPGMIDLARRVSPSSIRYRTADAGALPFQDDTFDVVTCGFGLSHMPDVPRVLTEVQRVLRTPGVMVASSWGEEGTNTAFAAALDVLTRYAAGQLHALGDIVDEGTWARTDRGSAALRHAGFARISARTESLTGEYRSPEDALAWGLAWPDYGETVDRLDPVDRSQFEREALWAIRSTHDLRWSFAINYYQAFIA